MKLQMGVGKKFTIVSTALVLLTIVLGCAALLGLGSISKAVHTINVDALDGISASTKLQLDLIDIHGNALNHIGSTNAVKMGEIETRIAALKQDAAKQLADVENTVANDEERGIIAKIGPAINRYYQLWDDVAPLSRG